MILTTYRIPDTTTFELLRNDGQLTDAVLSTHPNVLDITLQEVIAAPREDYLFNTDVVLKDGNPYLYLGAGKRMHLINDLDKKPRSLEALLESEESIQAAPTAHVPAAKTYTHYLLVCSAAMPLTELDVPHNLTELREFIAGVKRVVINTGEDLDFTQYRKLFNSHIAGAVENVGVYASTDGTVITLHEVLTYDATRSTYIGRLAENTELWLMAVVRAKFVGKYTLGQILSKDSALQVTKESTNFRYFKTCPTLALGMQLYANYMVNPQDALLIAYRKPDTTYYTIEKCEAIKHGDLGI